MRAISETLCIESSFLETFDVASPYTNIPTNEGIAAVQRAFLRFPDPRRPDLTLLTLISIILKNNYFLLCGERFLQKSGTAWGCAFGSSFANSFLAEWEENIFYFYKPPVWFRFIDDIFLIWPLTFSELFSFRDFVNSIAPTINNIRFLDLLLMKRDGLLNFKIGFEPTDSLYLVTIDFPPAPCVYCDHFWASVSLSDAQLDLRGHETQLPKDTPEVRFGPLCAECLPSHGPTAFLVGIWILPLRLPYLFLIFFDESRCKSF